MTGPLNLYAKNGSYGDIQKATSSTSPRLDVCIREGVINPMAKYKPQRSPVIGKLTASQRAAGGWGFDTSGGSDSIYFYSLAGALNQCIAKNGEWTYLRPRGVVGSYNEPFRYFDFLNADSPTSAGYAGDAPRPYSYTFPGDQSTALDEWSASVRVTRAANAGQIALSDFLIGGLSIGSYKYALLLRKKNTSDINLILSNSTVSSLGYGSYINLDFTLQESGEFQGCVVVTNATAGGDGTGDTIYLPYSYFTVKHTKVAITVNYYLAWNSGSPTLSNDMTYITLPSILNAVFAAGRETYGQPYKVYISILAVSDGVSEDIQDIELDPELSIPSGSTASTVPIDLDSVGSIISLNRDVSGYSSLELRTTIQTTGTNGSGVSAILNCTNAGGYMSDTIQIPK